MYFKDIEDARSYARATGKKAQAIVTHEFGFPKKSWKVE